MLNLNASILGGLPVGIPPLELQRKFVAAATSRRWFSNRATTYLATTDGLQSALAQHALAGRL